MTRGFDMKPFPGETRAAQILEEIQSRGSPGLGPGEIQKGSWRKSLSELSREELLGVETLADRGAASCVRAGLLLLGDDLDGSHKVSQELETVDGCYWHGIMHRRDGDFGNSKYWFRRVGDHPVFEELTGEVSSTGGKIAEILPGGRWDPFEIVDLIEACVSGKSSELEDELVELQKKEMLILLAHCYRKGTA